MGDNPDYLNEYTTNPTNPTNGAIITIAQPGTISGTDPRFIPGQKSGVPIISYLASKLLLGFDVSFAYNITTVNGVTKITVTDITSGIIGNTVGSTWTSLSNNPTISGNIINFTITGNVGTYLGGEAGTVYQYGIQITGTYNTLQMVLIQ